MNNTTIKGYLWSVSPILTFVQGFKVKVIPQGHPKGNFGSETVNSRVIIIFIFETILWP
jgi:hypothetical protein